MIGQDLSHYRILEKLGEGGMGVLYRARDARLDRSVAIKVLHPEALASPERRRRLAQEAKAVSALNHPHIVTVHDVGQARVNGHEVDFIVMECVEGRTLDELLSERRLGLVEALDYAIQMAEGLAAAHDAGIVHRDVKPANVMVGAGGRLKMLDFGLAKAMGEQGPRPEGDTESATGEAAVETRGGSIVGTAAYMSPEQADERPVDARSDIFSLGAVLYEMLAGRRPFQGGSRLSTLAAILRDAPPPLDSLRPDVPSDLQRIVLRCLAKDRDQRYPTARELLLDLIACRARVVARGSGWRAALRQPRYAVPAAAAVALIGGLVAWAWTRGAQERWARDVALPEIDRLVARNQYYDAFWVAREAGRYLSNDPRLDRFWKDRCFLQTVRTTPPGAEVSMRSFGDRTGEWRSIGRTPLQDVPMPFELLKLRITKEGFEPVDATTDPNGRARPLEFTLDPRGAVPADMVRVPRGQVRFREHSPVDLDDFWLDRYEVTNRQFKDFIDQGGYRTRAYWTQPFARDSRTLSWEEGMSAFRDATGQPGPAGWELSAYPDGRDDYPVDGVSWFEADAYARYARKALPTVFHWFRASDAGLFVLFSDVIEASNFAGHGPAAVGSHAGMSPYGTYDMAGNVREWCANAEGDRRYILGGAWSDPGQASFADERRSPWDRAAGNGFRCARYAEPLPAALVAAIEPPTRAYWARQPASDAEFRGYERFINSYDRTELNPVVEGVDEARNWRREKVSFDAAYGKERVLAHLFLPRNARPPYQTVVYHAGPEGRLTKSLDNLRLAYFDYIVLSGRAVFCPAFKGHFERRVPAALGGPAAYRDQVVQMNKDLRRSLDYLDTRPDIDHAKLAMETVSGPFGIGALVFDKRLRVGIMQSVGLPPYTQHSAGWEILPEIDPFHVAPRVRAPVLMLNGRYDALYPPETHQDPLFRLLGTPAKDKRHVLFDCGHSLLRTPGAIRETLDWLDRYLGPVRTAEMEAR
jgi:predicted Ser/Thr protein kinase